MVRFTYRVGAIVAVAAAVPVLIGTTAAPASARVTWKECLDQKPEWYSSAEAVQVADNLLIYQHDNGGWTKNVDMAAPLSPSRQAELEDDKDETETTIDNHSTYTQMEYLARVYNAAPAKGEKYKTAFLKGLDYLLSAQYPNGGWPQFYPLRKGYYSHITFNDDAMMGVMFLLRDIARNDPAYSFVDADRRAKCARAVQKGIDCILKCQIVTDGKKTVWCAQHDENTFAPAPARKYEKISLSGDESVGIVQFLMGVEHPSPQIREAIDGAVAWFRAAKLTGIKVVKKPEAGTPKGYDIVVEKDPAAPPLWARFYEIGTNRPIFCGRDSVVKYDLAGIEYERRNGYRWYGPWADELLNKDYPRWQAKVAAVPAPAENGGAKTL